MSQRMPDDHPEARAWTETEDYRDALWAAFHQGWLAADDERKNVERLEGAVEITEEEDHRLVDCDRCPAKDRCEHQGADACCFGQWGVACNVPNACRDQDACKVVAEKKAVVVVEEADDQTESKTS